MKMWHVSDSFNQRGTTEPIGSTFMCIGIECDS